MINLFEYGVEFKIDVNPTLSIWEGIFPLVLNNFIIFFWNAVLSSWSLNIACTSSLSNGIWDILPFSTLYEANEFESTITCPLSVSLTTIAESGSVLAVSKVWSTNDLSITSSETTYGKLPMC